MSCTCMILYMSRLHVHAHMHVHTYTHYYTHAHSGTNRVGGIEILEVGGATNELVVDHHGEPNVQDDVVVDG